VDLLHREQGPSFVTGDRRWRGLRGLGLRAHQTLQTEQHVFALAPTRHAGATALNTFCGAVEVRIAAEQTQSVEKFSEKPHMRDGRAVEANVSGRSTLQR
jgi:hypothetical protein